MSNQAIGQASYMRLSAPVEMLTCSGRLTARITCNGCGSHEEWSINGRAPPPEQLPAHFKKRGWQIRNRTTCPHCAIKSKEKPMSKPATVTPISVAANTDAAKKNKRTVIIALEDYFDENARQYRDGQSDDKVAGELGLAPAFVAMVREEFFGKLAEPSEVQAMRNEVAALEKSMAAVKARLETLVARNGWAA